MTAEEWRPIVGAEVGYEVSSFGRVRSLRKVLRPGMGRPKYLGVVIKMSSGKAVHRRVHVLVAEAFIGPRPLKHDVAHNDGCATNNCSENLRYATRKENMADAMSHGTVRSGERHTLSKLTLEKARLIKEKYVPFCPEWGGKALAKKLNVSPMAVSDVVRGARWKKALSEYQKAMEEAK